jgi:hypothetical protein
MPKFLTAKDTNYVKGMNSLDDPKILSDGEAAEIVNAIPDIPLKMRRGCVGKIITDSGGNPYRIVSKPFYVSYPATNYLGRYELLFFWRGDASGSAQLCYFNLRLPYSQIIPTSAVSISNSNVLPSKFDFTRVGNIIYTRASNPYDNNVEIYKMFAIEINDRYGLEVTVRKVPTAGFNAQITLQNNIQYMPGLAVGYEYQTFSPSSAFGYSATYVRRVNTTGADATGRIMTYAPGLIESPEIPSSRWGVVLPTIAPSRFSILVKPGITLTPNNNYGFTHVRIYRTENLYSTLSTSPIATLDDKINSMAGAVRYFVMDIPISSFFDGNNNQLPSIDQIDDPYILARFADTVTPDALKGEMNQLFAFNYTLPPADGYRMLYFKNRLFLMGERGMVYFSEIPGGDGGGDLEFATTEYAKYALWFKPLTYRLELDVGEHTASTGLDYFGDDLYLFKENKVYMIIGGDPLASPLRTVNDKTGCPFPDTITRAIIGGREVLFYLGNAGPMLITDGGNSRPFTEFKVKELWPESRSALYRVSEITYDHSNIELCSAVFWNNTLWVFIREYDSSVASYRPVSSKIFGYRSTDEANGAFEVRIADIEKKYIITDLVTTNDNRAITISDILSVGMALVDFLSNEESCDTLQEAPDGDIHSARPTFSLLSRKIYPGPLERSISELFRVTSYCDFSEDGQDFYDRQFKIEIFNRRLRTNWIYQPNYRMFLSNQFGEPVAGEWSFFSFQRTDGGAWKPDELVGFVAGLYNDDSPDSVRIISVTGNTETDVYFNYFPGPYDFTHIRFIPVSTIRLNIDFVPKADFVGEYFQYLVTKVIPFDRHFNWYGLELQALPRPQLDVESLVGGMDVRNSWE